MPKKKQRPFVVIEALDAGGSQTQTDALVKRLKKEKYKPLQLHFPQEDRPTGKFIYGKFLDVHNEFDFTRREQALIYIQDFFARKADIEKALAGPKKSLVVSDRFYTSTMAYQSAGLSNLKRDTMLEWIRNLVELSEPALPKPTRVIFLDTTPGVSLHHLRNQSKNYHEKLSKLIMFRKSYLALAREQKNWVVINSMTRQGAQRSIEDIHAEVWRKIKPLL